MGIGFEARLREELEKKDITLIGIENPFSEETAYVLAGTQKVATSSIIPLYIFEDADAAVGVSDCICMALEDLEDERKKK